MVKEIPIAELRRRWGIKKLKVNIPTSGFEKEAIKNLREEDERRVKRAHKIKA
jgi:hypothetical protein